MNIKLSIICLVLMAVSLVFGCKGRAAEDNKSNAPTNAILLHPGDEHYVPIDTRQSVVEWRGSSLEGSHTGYVYLSKGEFMMENGQLAGGSFEVAMSTIEGDDHRSDNNLINHLKDIDFFNVTKFPVSTIQITGVESSTGVESGTIENKNVTGNLTIKGITHPVTFPVKMEISNGILRAEGKLVIDRTKWGIQYRSGKLFDSLKEHAIADSIELGFNIIAKPESK